jgi:dolichol-phosphate mannosyltransferase
VPDDVNPTLVIVPTYNERDNLPGIVEALAKLSVDLLVVDDSSPDGTGELADELAAKYNFVNVLHRQQKNGLGRAYCAGFEWALEHDYEFVFEMDGDFSHDPNDIPRFLKMADEADLVLGTRYRGGIRVNNWPLRRLMLSLGAAKYVKWITGMPFSDPTGGYKCFRRRALESVDLADVRSNGYSFQIEMTHKIWRQGLRVAEQNIVFTERIEGTSKMSWHIAWEAVWMVWRLWLQHGLRRWPKKKQG